MDAAYTRTFTVLYTCPDNGKSGLRGPIIAIREHNVILWQISRGKRNCHVIWRKIMSSHKWMIFKRSSVKVKVVEIDFHWWEKKWLTRIITSEIWGDLLEEGERAMITGSLYEISRVGAVVRAFAFYQCGLGFDSLTNHHMWVKFICWFSTLLWEVFLTKKTTFYLICCDFSLISVREPQVH